MRFALVFVLAFAAGLFAASSGSSLPRLHASGHENQTVRLIVTVQEVEETGEGDRCFDPWGFSLCDNPEFYAIVTIDGEEMTGPAGDSASISPDWEFEKEVVLGQGSAGVSIEIWDEDSFLRLDDDHADIIDGSGQNIDVNVVWNANDLSTASLTGDITSSLTFVAPAGVQTSDLGSEGDGDGNGGDARVQFKIELEFPPAAPAVTPSPSNLSDAPMRIFALQSPLHPSTSESVTITAEVIDDTGAPRPASRIEIWVDTDGQDPGPSSPSEVCTPAGSAVSITDCSTARPPFSFSKAAYGALAVDDSTGQTVWTGWRVMGVGSQGSSANPIPISVSGPQESRLDVVFIPDETNYAGNISQFLVDISNTIRQGYYLGAPQDAAAITTGIDIFVVNQNRFNFWYTSQTAEIVREDDPAADPQCDQTPPDNWNEELVFADVGPIIHADAFRDCAPGSDKLFSTEWFSFRTLLHETGHRPFGMADEYSDDGGYFQADPHPNLYANEDDCEADPLLGTPGARNSCSGFTESHFWGRDWWRVDPDGDHMLAGDRGQPRATDVRRINWMFGNCQASRC